MVRFFSRQKRRIRAKMRNFIFAVSVATLTPCFATVVAKIMTDLFGIPGYVVIAEQARLLGTLNAPALTSSTLRH